MDQCHCHDRPIILLHCVSLSRSHSRWAYIKHILDLLTANYRDHRVKDKAVAASCQNARIKMSVNIEHFKVTSILTLIFRDKKECLKWVFAAIRKLLRWAKTWYCCEKSFADLASCDRAVRPVCAEREKPKETRCRETFKIGTTGLDQQYNLESFGMGVEITFSET